MFKLYNFVLNDVLCGYFVVFVLLLVVAFLNFKIRYYKAKLKKNK